MKKSFAILLLTLVTITTFANTNRKHKKHNNKHHRQSIRNGHKYGVHCHNYLTVIG